MNKQTRFDFACQIARQAGELANSYFANLASLTVQDKGVQDMATEADVNTENLIRAAIEANYPNDNFLGEESYEQFDAEHARHSGAGTWVVDPIDGTQPFVSGIPTWCISLSYVVNNQVQIGVIYDPNNNELFAAEVGKGATLNGKPMQASQVHGVDNGLIGIGYSNRVTPEATLLPLERLIRANGMFHRCGSGALSLAYVASGRLIGYFEPHMNSWDFSAGMLLVQEAGGRTNDCLAADDALIKGDVVLAAAAGVFEPLQAIVNG
ncbi:inositol monophosphatase [Oceanicoccus sp. KOV_DT_Chl]|uniref:inositol monophosphatase family protein n=1 Tax=Oceanicoccus sp. KOV_DT_Chl TaxID=1904639 RepID=UPI000C7B5B03|nr:inositol monophosphatase [Oceanicoccus sp. KOV_DT_Chl]